MSKKYLDKEGLQRVWQKILNNFLTKNEAASLVPTKVSSFENDAEYISEGADVSLLENDANYQNATQVATAIAAAITNALFIGDNISNLENDSLYQTQSQVAATVADAVRDAIYKFDDISLLTNDMNYQTLTQVVELINNAIGGIVSLRFEVVDELPETGLSGTIYLVPTIYTEDNLEIQSDMAKDDIFMTAIERTLFKTNKAFSENDIVSRNSRDLTKLDFDPYVDTTSPASRDFSIDEYFLDGRTLYVVTDEISEGDSFVVDTNIESVTYTAGIGTLTSHPHEHGDAMLIGGKGYVANSDMPAQSYLYSTSDVSRDTSIDTKGNIYIEWYYTPDTKRWETIGSTTADLTGYYTKEETDSEIGIPVSYAVWQTMTPEQQNTGNWFVYGIPDEYVTASKADVQEVSDDLSDLKTQVNGLVDLFYPVGSIFMSTDSTNPGERFTGTTWVAWGSGRVPVGVDENDTDFDTAEETGGAKSHSYTPAGSVSQPTFSGTAASLAHSGGGVADTALTVAQLPSHNHTFTGSSATTASQSTSTTGGRSAYHQHTVPEYDGATTEVFSSHGHTTPQYYAVFNSGNQNTGVGYGTNYAYPTDYRNDTKSDGGKHSHTFKIAARDTGNDNTEHTHSYSHTHTLVAKGSVGSTGSGTKHGHTYTRPDAHSYTPAGTVSKPSFTGTAATQSHVQPYVTCYMWKRTA